MELLKEINGITLHIKGYGANEDYFFRLSPVDSRSEQKLNDAYIPSPEIGALWVRRRDNRWIVSGLLKQTLFADKFDAQSFVELLLETLLNITPDHVGIHIVNSIDKNGYYASGEE